MSQKKLSSKDLLMILAVGLIALGALNILNVVVEQFFPGLRRLLTVVSGFVWPLTFIIVGLIILRYVRGAAPVANKQGRLLRRSVVNRKIAGVCGGFAEFIDKDPFWVRVIALTLFLVTGVFPIGILYIMLWVVVPEGGVGSRR